MPTRPKALLEPLGISVFYPAPGSNVNKGLVPNFCVCGSPEKYPRLQSIQYCGKTNIPWTPEGRASRQSPALAGLGLMPSALLYFDLRPGPKLLFRGNTPEGSDTFQRPVIGRDRVGGLRLMIWDKVKVLLCH